MQDFCKVSQSKGVYEKSNENGLKNIYWIRIDNLFNKQKFVSKICSKTFVP